LLKIKPVLSFKHRSRILGIENTFRAGCRRSWSNELCLSTDSTHSY